MAIIFIITPGLSALMEELPLLVNEADQQRIPAGSKLHVLLISLLTDWPWEKAAFLSGNENTAKIKSVSCLQLLCIISIAIMVLIAMVLQGFISFHRDRLDESSLSESIPLPALHGDLSLYNNRTKDKETAKFSMTSNETNDKPDLQLFADDIILDIITIALLAWVLWNKLRLLCRSSETENLHIENENQPKDTLTHLVDGVRYTLPTKVMSKLFVIIPFIYIIFSLLVSVMYLYVYFNQNTHVMWPKDWKITGSFKIAVIVIILVGYTAIDLLYIQILLRYVLQCQLNIYFLQLIISKVESETYRSQDEAIQDVERAQKFLKKLNRSSKVTGFAIITALIQAINCATNLLNDMDDSKENKSKIQFEEIALIFRLFLWICLAMVPFYQAARTNETSEALSDTGLAMFKPPVLFAKNTRSQNSLIKSNYIAQITLRAKIFNLPIKPGFIYLAVIVMLLTFALKSAFQLYEQLL